MSGVLTATSEDLDVITICLGEEVDVEENIVLHSTPEEWRETGITPREFRSKD